MQFFKLAVLAAIMFWGIFMPLGSHAAVEADTPIILINLPSRTLEYYEEGSLVREYRVAIGSSSSPTPLGTFYITDKEVNPAWYPPGKGYSVPSGPANPLGYRWMGFLPTYGVHGTNMPWSIGRVVSNGCIRMLEEDVEELFEMVRYRTPVKITYDRVKLRIDPQGNASIGIYPDVYGYKSVALPQVEALLAEKGLSGLADESFLTKLIADESEQQIIFAQVFDLEVNGRKLTEHVVALDGALYLPAMAVAEIMSTKLTWDQARSTLSRKQQAFPAILKGRTVYVNINYAGDLFGGKYSWKNLGRCFALQIPTLFFAGLPLTSDIHTAGNEKLIPALVAAEALGIKLTWNADTKVLRNSIRPLPVEIIDGEPYLASNNFGEYFNAAVTWDDEQQLLDMTASAYELDCSMYLDLMQDFLNYEI